MSEKTIGYAAISRLNHWVVAVLMMAMLAFGFYVFEFVPRGPDKGALIGLHKSVGLLILVLGSWRVAWRVKQGFLPSLHSGWQAQLSHLAHWILLTGIVVMPVSGVIGSYFGGRATPFFKLLAIQPGPKIEWLSEAAYTVHSFGAYAVVGVVALHVAGALKHQLIDKDGTLARMTGRR